MIKKISPKSHNEKTVAKPNLTRHYNSRIATRQDFFHGSNLLWKGHWYPSQATTWDCAQVFTASSLHHSYMVSCFRHKESFNTDFVSCIYIVSFHLFQPHHSPPPAGTLCFMFSLLPHGSFLSGVHWIYLHFFPEHGWDRILGVRVIYQWLYHQRTWDSPPTII